MKATACVAKTLFIAACAGGLGSCSEEPTPRTDEGERERDVPAAPSDVSATRPDVLLISLDTLRADALSCYGNPHDTTPVMDALAARGTRFADCYAPSPHTAPSHVSLFTGLDPLAHGVSNATTSSQSLANLNAATPTLGERLSDAGWRVVMVGGRGQLRPAMGIAKGSDFHHFRSTTFLDGLEVFEDVVGAEDADEPLFAFFHTYEPHAPYLPPREFEGERFRGRYTDPTYDGRFRLRYEALIDDPDAAEKAGSFLQVGGGLSDADRAFLRGLYDENVAWTDFLLGRLFEAWSRHRDLDHTLVVLVSDHGDQLGERNGSLGHRSGVWRELAHVPLIIAGPGVDARVVETPVGLTGLPATLLEMLDVEPLPVASPSLVPLLADGATAWRLPAFAQDAFGRRRSFSAALTGLQSIVFEREGANTALHFDLGRDPTGRTPFESVPQRAVDLRMRLNGRVMADRAHALQHPPAVVQLRDEDAGLRRRLAELGYTDGDDE